MKNQRSVVMDIAKGLGIIAVVIGHAGAPVKLTKFVYLFHLPLFFFISGYFWKDSYLTDVTLFIKKKVKELYLPFVKIQLVFLALNNFLFSIYVYSTNSYWTNLQYVQTPLTYRQTIQRFTDIILFNGQSAQLLGASWFVVLLFFMFFLFALVSYFTAKKPEYYRFAVVSIIFLFGFFLVENGVSLSASMHTGLIAMGIFYLGFLYKKYGQKVKLTIPVGLAGLLVLLVARNKFDIVLEMARNVYPNPIVFLIISLAGICLVLSGSKALEHFTIPAKVFSFVGKNTLAILFLHFAAFKLITLAYIWYRHYPIQMLARFPVIFDSNKLWVAYVVCGVVLPILINVSYNYIKRKISEVSPSKALHTFNKTKSSKVGASID